jgi:hypothetical protein
MKATEAGRQSFAVEEVVNFQISKHFLDTSGEKDVTPGRPLRFLKIELFY